MEPVAKAKLIESFMEVLNQAGILNVSEVSHLVYYLKYFIIIFFHTYERGVLKECVLITDSTLLKYCIEKLR